MWTRSTSPIKGGHIPALDGLRGLAILLVLMAHVAVQPTDKRVDQLVDFVRSLGWMGVDLFFVLSGFLITGLLLDAKGGPGYFRTFYVRRVLRIFPLYYLTLAFMFIVAPRLSGMQQAGALAERAWWYWLYLENISNVVNGVPIGEFGRAFGHVWSLSVEEQVYLVWPLVVLLVPRSRLGWVCMGAFLFAPVFRLLLVNAGVGSQGPYELTLARIDTFAVGAALALLVRSKRGLSGMGSWPSIGLILCGCILLALSKIGGADVGETFGMQVIGYSAAAVAFGSLLALALTARYPRKFFESSVLRLYGKYSYAIYLIHLPLWAVLQPALWRPDEPPTLFGSHLPAQVLAYLIMLVLSLIGGWLSWTLIERHFLALKRFFPYAESKPQLRTSRSGRTETAGLASHAS